MSTAKQARNMPREPDWPDTSVKIGYTTIEIPENHTKSPWTVGESNRAEADLFRNRISTLQVGNTWPLVYEYGWVPCGHWTRRNAGKEAESWLHETLRPFKERGEWFKFPQEVWAYAVLQNAVHLYEEETGICMPEPNTYIWWQKEPAYPGSPMPHNSEPSHNSKGWTTASRFAKEWKPIGPRERLEQDWEKVKQEARERRAQEKAA